MTADPSSFGAGRGLAMARVAEAMLRALDGVEVQLRSAPSFSEGGNPRLGLAQGSSGDVSFAPVVVRNAGGKESALEFLFAAAAVDAEVQRQGCKTAQQLFAIALGLVHDGKLLRVRRVETELHAGTPYLYRVTASE